MENEWNIKGNTIRYDPKKDVLYLKITNEAFKAEDHDFFDEITREVYKGRSGDRHVIIDLSESKARMMSKEEREAYKQKMSGGNATADKFAIIGASPSIRMFAKVLIKLNRVDNSGFFKNEAEALKWLKE